MPKPSTTATESDDLEAGRGTAAATTTTRPDKINEEEEITHTHTAAAEKEKEKEKEKDNRPSAPDLAHAHAQDEDEHDNRSLLHHDCDFPDPDDEDPRITTARAHCLGLLRKVFYVMMPLSIVASVFACLYGWIFVNTQHYLSDPDAWQRCIVYNSNAPGATAQNFAVSASAFGGLMFIFMGLGFKAGYLALQELELLPYSLSVTCFTLLGQMVYRPVNPVVPAVTELTPTLVSLTYFINKDMYLNVPNNDPCMHAYRVNACFLAFQYIIFAANIANFFIQIYAAIRLRKVPRQEPYILVWHKPALALVFLSLCSYVLTIAAKEDAALKTMFLLEKVGHGYLFPFQRPALDTVGLFMLLTVASVIFGACKQNPESFKWGAFTAYVHVLLSYPIILANFQAYHLYGFWSDESCTHFLETDNTHAGGGNRQLLFLYASINYPELEQGFCRDTRIALMGQFCQFVCMHLAVLACLCVVMANWRMEAPTRQLQLFGSKASSFLFPNVPPGQEGLEEEGGLDGLRRRTLTRTPPPPTAGTQPGSLQEPLLTSGAGGAGGGRGGGGGHQHHRRVSSGAASVLSHRSRKSSVSNQNHLLGPLLD